MGLSFSKTGVGFLGSLLNLGLLIPCIAVAVRRLHDTGRSGWWLLILLILILLIPLIGTTVYFVFLIQDGTAGDNSYGPNPKNSAT